MQTEILHPDRLGPGDTIGPWRVLEVLGAGGLGRVFRVEQDGRDYALKMATRLPGQRAPGEEDVDGWCTREATMLLERTPHPNIPRVFQVGRWPHPESGFLYTVMEYVDGWRFHDWRYEKHPTAAQLVEVLRPLVRTLADLHKADIQHRDLNANNVLIRKEDGQPVLLDFSSVSLPGARTLTQGMPPMAFTVMPPEAFEHARLKGEDARFRGGPAADLYALGVLMYQALTDGYPFNPELPPERLLAAITVGVPRAPHWVNPKVPPSLSAITMRLLSKRPEDRYESAEALHQALWEANKARTSRAWKVPLDLPESGPAPMTDEELRERELEAERVQRARAVREQEESTSPGENATEGAREVPPTEDVFARMSEVPARHTKASWTWQRARRPVVAAVACALGVGVVALTWWGTHRSAPPSGEVSQASSASSHVSAGGEVATPDKPPEARPAEAPDAGLIATDAPRPVSPPKESDSVKTSTSPSSPALRAARKMIGAAVTCSALTGCPGAQVRSRPPPEECPSGALEAMKERNIELGDRALASLDLRTNAHVMTVREGRNTFIIADKFGNLPGGSTVSGRLIFGDRVYGRLTEVQTPDGETFPVCVQLEDHTLGGVGIIRKPDVSPDTARIFSTVNMRVVRRFE